MSRENRLVHFQPDGLHPTVFVAAGAVILGDVTLGAESSVWFHSVLRGDTCPLRIGQRTNIQDGCILHADPGFPCEIADGVTLGHGAIVHGAILEENVLIGMRAVVMNGARVGRDSLIGVGSVVLEGQTIPPGSLVLGVPGKIVRALKPEEIERTRSIAAHYVQAARDYQAHGHPRIALQPGIPVATGLLNATEQPKAIELPKATELGSDK